MHPTTARSGESSQVAIVQDESTSALHNARTWSKPCPNGEIVSQPPDSADSVVPPRRRLRWLWYLLAIAGVVTLGATVLLAVLLGRLHNALPRPTGSMACGRTTFYWTDESRPESSANTAARRELRVDLWYPAETNQGTLAPYCEDFAQLRTSLGAERYVLGRVATHTLSDPAVKQDPPDRFPVGVFSPGNAMNAGWYTSLIEELVSHGYVVAAIDHPAESAAIAYPGGRVVVVKEPEQPFDPAKFEQSYRERVDGRAADMSFVLGRLAMLDRGELEDSRFVNRLDLESVGALGHSIGGVGAAKAAQLDPRFKAVVNLDGHFAGKPFIPNSDGGGPPSRFLELCDREVPPADDDLARWKTTRADYEAARQRVNESLRTESGTYRVSLAGANHQAFSDNSLWLPTGRDAHLRQTKVVRNFTRAYFDLTLADSPEMWRSLLESPPEGVSVEHFTSEAVTR